MPDEQTGTAPAGPQTPQDQQQVQEPTQQTQDQTADQQAQQQLDQAAQAQRHEPAPGSPRWNEIYRKNKEQERRIADLEATLAGLQQSQQPQSQDPVTIIRQLREQRKAAATALDIATVEEINDQIRNLENQLWAKHNEEVMRGVTSRSTEQAVVENFAKQTEWFNEGKDTFNEPMAVYAIHLKGRLAPSWRGSLPDLLDEVRTRTEEAFNYQRPTTQVKPRSYVQEGTQTTQAPRQASLTPDERKVAETYFGNEKDPYKAYADSKARLGRQ